MGASRFGSLVQPGPQTQAQQQPPAQEYRVDVGTFSEVCQGPEEMLGALVECLQGRSMQAAFYNPREGAFREARCVGYGQLEARAAYQSRCLEEAQQIASALLRARQDVEAGSARNQALLRDVLQRQLTLSLVLLQVVDQAAAVDPAGERAARLRAAAAQDAPARTFSGARLRAHVQRQAAVLAALLQATE